MNFVWWLTGVLATLAALKFVFLVFRKLTSKESMNAVIERAQEGMHDAANKVVKKIQTKKNNQKKEKQERTDREYAHNRAYIEIR